MRSLLDEVWDEDKLVAQIDNLQAMINPHRIERKLLESAPCLHIPKVHQPASRGNSRGDRQTENFPSGHWSRGR